MSNSYVREKPSELGLFSRVVSMVAMPFVMIAQANQMQREYDQLAHLSDEALAQRGLKREDIPRYVCRNILDK